MTARRVPGSLGDREYLELEKRIERELKKRIGRVLKGFALRAYSWHERERLLKRLPDRLKKEAERVFGIAIGLSTERAEREAERLGLGVGVPERVANRLAKSREYRLAIEAVGREARERASRIVREELSRPEGTTLERVTERLQKEAGVVARKAAGIARTLLHGVLMAQREHAYREAERRGLKILYRWINPLDDRTTSVCRSIVRRTRNGVPLEELKRIVREESVRGGFGWFYSPDRPWTPHPNCRSAFVPVRIERMIEKRMARVVAG